MEMYFPHKASWMNRLAAFPGPCSTISGNVTDQWTSIHKQLWIIVTSFQCDVINKLIYNSFQLAFLNYIFY